MTCGEYASPTFIHSLHNAPYSSALATSASASSASVWSDTASQSSDDSSASAPTSDSDSCASSCSSYPSQTSESACEQAINLINPWSKHTTQTLPQLHIDVVAPELRKNPRRSSTSSTTRSGCPPPLVRQADRKVNFVDNLVDSSTQIVEAIWPTSSVVCRNETGNNSVLPLRTFIQETLRRSRTSYSTLQVALYYLILIKAHVPEHDFTMEQPVDCHASRALQCGRRMFLAALILASKYLQDRNYSARAWSRISGLATQEINQNEMAFLAAVNWRLHITEEVYHRWTDCVMKFKPPQPPSPGSPCQRQFEQQCEEFRAIVIKLTPELDNIDDMEPYSPVGSRSRDFPAVSPKWLSAASERSPAFGSFEPIDATPTPRSYGTPNVMEPTPTPAYTPGRLAPALGLLPTPRLTPQTSGFSTPAVSAVPFLLGRGSSMGYAMAQASGVNTAQTSDRWPVSSTSSPQPFSLTRRSSLANSVSTASSPESMVSDSSRVSRSSSISSASSLASAPYAKLDVLARCRSAKQCSERFNLRPTIASVPEDYAPCLTSSPEYYSGPVGKDLCDLSMETPLGRREREMDDAARALQELQSHRSGLAPVAQRPSLKRSRTFSVDNSLQENVRDMLNGRLSTEVSWPDHLVRRPGLQVPVQATLGGSRKRLCCSSEAAESYGNVTLLHPSMTSVAGPGMWEGIL